MKNPMRSRAGIGVAEVMWGWEETGEGKINNGGGGRCGAMGQAKLMRDGKSDVGPELMQGLGGWD